MTQRDAGFTLVEAMISLFVFSLIAAGSVTMLMQSVETQRRVEVAQEALREVQTARALLSADLAQFTSRATRDAAGNRRPRFIGGDAAAPLAFVRAAAEPDGEGGAVTSLSFVWYTLDGDSVLRSSSADLDQSEGPARADRVLLSGVTGAHFEFFDGAEWRSQWLVANDGGALPRAVALVFASPRYGPMRIEAPMGVGG
ncbi:MAG: type II secretion system minor pseudopilin GspJ [Hyphomonadaceae bacterium]